MPLHVDLKNAVENPETNNFKCLLFRLMLKADPANLAKLTGSYPVEGRMAYLYRNVPMATSAGVDYESIEAMAQSAVGEPSVGAAPPAMEGKKT